MTCFDRDFLASAASRRDLWRLLLPLPGIIALVADRGNHELMFMDVRRPRKEERHLLHKALSDLKKLF